MTKLLLRDQPGSPDKLQQVVREHTKAVRRLRFTTPPNAIAPGQLWTLRKDQDTAGPARFAVILEAGTERGGGLRFAPVSVETEHAGAYDLLVPMEQSPIGCSFMVEGWQIEEAARNVLGEAIGSLPDKIVEDALNVAAAHAAGIAPTGVSGQTGFAQGSYVDRLRKSFQARERRIWKEALTPFR